MTAVHATNWKYASLLPLSRPDKPIWSARAEAK
jgi:hypothetical protein